MIPIPTGLLLKAGTGALLAAVLVFGGCHWQKGRDEAKIAKLNTTIDGLQASLRGSAVALRAVNDEAKRRIKAAEDAALAGIAAGEAAEAEKRRLAAQSKKAGEDFDRRLLIAQRRVACRAWLDTNVQEVCGL